MAKSKKTKVYEYDRKTAAISTRAHRRLKSRASALGGSITHWLGLAAEHFSRIPGGSEEDVERNAQRAIGLIRLYLRDKTVRQDLESGIAIELMMLAEEEESMKNRQQPDHPQGAE